MSVDVRHGDCREVIKTMAEASVHAVVTDPPYSLVSIQKRFGKPGQAPAQHGTDGLYRRASAGFMGQQWDNGETAHDPAFWAEVYRVMKPGAHLVAFGGTRTYHRLATAIEDAGFEIRDQLGFCFGTGFPKSHSVEKGAGEAICRCPAGDHSVRRMRKAAHDASGMAAQSEDADVLASVQRRAPREGLGTARPQGIESQNAGILHEGSGEDAWREEPGLEGRGDLPEATRQLCERPLCEVSAGVRVDGAEGRLCDGTPTGDGASDRLGAVASGVRPPRRPQAVEQRAEQSGTVAGQSQPQDGGAWPHCGRCGKPMVPAGLGTALKPAWEPIVLARKPLSGTVAETVLQHGTGALNIDGCRIHADDAQGGEYTVTRLKPGATLNETGGNWRPEEGGVEYHGEMKPGRWPANLCHDGSEEVLAAFPQSDGQLFATAPHHKPKVGTPVYGDYGPRPHAEPRGDSGSAARFFYSAKADADDRADSKHPTVKPVSLMRWLVRLITPPGGLVLDPFAGSGTTGVACIREGFDCILIEREAQYIADIKHRLNKLHGGDTPLFMGAAT